MRSFEEIDRDMAGMKDQCQRRNHGCNYPNCDCALSDVDKAQPVKDLSASASPATKEQQ